MILHVNGRARDVSVPDHASLLSALRDALQLTGTKEVCDRGECGACTVLLDGAPVYSCLTLAAACAADENRITTIEGVGTPDAPHPVGAAFATHDAAQCGFCTPGQILAAIALLARDPHPSDEAIRSGMSGNLCRCGTYPRIVEAIRSVARTSEGAHAAGPAASRDRRAGGSAA